MKVKQYRFVVGSAGGTTHNIRNLVNEAAKEGWTIVPGTVFTFQEEGLQIGLFMEMEFE